MTSEVRDLPFTQGVDSTPTQTPQIEPIPAEHVLEVLDLTTLSRPLTNSVRGSLWEKIGNGNIFLEFRNATILHQPRVGRVIISDFDDCLMSATRWHKREFEGLEQNRPLHQMGINIPLDRAKEIYELSKIRVPGTVEQEPRYTPRLNLIQLTIYAAALGEGAPKGNPEEQAWSELTQWHQVITQQVQRFGEKALRVFAINPVIERVFMKNSPADFLYGDFVQDVLAWTSPNDIRIIATRGKIEGPLGQIYKVHSSGLMRQRSWRGQGVDLVIYSNDIKAEAILTVMRILPCISNRLIQIYDDNPSEVLPYLKMISDLGATNIEVIQVSHPDAKRKNVNLDIEPRLDHMRGETRLRHYSPFSKAKSPI